MNLRSEASPRVGARSLIPQDPDAIGHLEPVEIAERFGRTRFAHGRSVPVGIPELEVLAAPERVVVAVEGDGPARLLSLAEDGHKLGSLADRHDRAVGIALGRDEPEHVRDVLGRKEVDCFPEPAGIDVDRYVLEADDRGPALLNASLEEVMHDVGEHEGRGVELGCRVDRVQRRQHAGIPEVTTPHDVRVLSTIPKEARHDAHPGVRDTHIGQLLERHVDPRIAIRQLDRARRLEREAGRGSETRIEVAAKLTQAVAEPQDGPLR